MEKYQFKVGCIQIKQAKAAVIPIIASAVCGGGGSSYVFAEAIASGTDILLSMTFPPHILFARNWGEAVGHLVHIPQRGGKLASIDGTASREKEMKDIV